MATVYSLFKGFNKIGEYTSILKAKTEAPTEDGVYNLIDGGYRVSWQIVNGILYN